MAISAAVTRHCQACWHMCLSRHRLPRRGDSLPDGRSPRGPDQEPALPLAVFGVGLAHLSRQVGMAAGPGVRVELANPVTTCVGCFHRAALWSAARHPSLLKAGWPLSHCGCWPVPVLWPKMEILRMVMETGWARGTAGPWTMAWGDLPNKLPLGWVGENPSSPVTA